MKIVQSFINFWKETNVVVRLALIFLIAEIIFFLNFKIVVGFGSSMEPTIPSGSLLVCKKQSSYKVGDIVYYTIDGKHVVHRIKEVKDFKFSTDFDVTAYILQGDNNQSEDMFLVFKENIICKVM